MLKRLAYFFILLTIPPVESHTATAEASASARPTVEALAARVEAVTFRSTVLDEAKTFCAVLPEAYAPEEGPWPVLFLFHGRGRHERSLVDDPEARQVLLGAPFVTILPDGDDGWYINSPVKHADRYQDYMDEVIRIATAQYNLSTKPERRGLSGWSMGGYGCTRYAIDRLGQFGALAPIIGLLDFPRTGLPEGQSYAVPEERFGPDAAVWESLNPLHQAAALRGTGICIVTGTTAFDRTMNVHFSARLTELKIPHVWHLLQGGHTFDVVREALPIVVRFMGEAIAGG